MALVTEKRKITVCFHLDTMRNHAMALRRFVQLCFQINLCNNTFYDCNTVLMLIYIT